MFASSRHQYCLLALPSIGLFQEREQHPPRIMSMLVPTTWDHLFHTDDEPAQPPPAAVPTPTLAPTPAPTPKPTLPPSPAAPSTPTLVQTSAPTVCTSMAWFDGFSIWVSAIFVEVVLGYSVFGVTPSVWYPKAIHLQTRLCLVCLVMCMCTSFQSTMRRHRDRSLYE